MLEIITTSPPRPAAGGVDDAEIHIHSRHASRLGLSLRRGTAVLRQCLVIVECRNVQRPLYL
jgi:hypothetical protein